MQLKTHFFSSCKWNNHLHLKYFQIFKTLAEYFLSFALSHAKNSLELKMAIPSFCTHESLVKELLYCIGGRLLEGRRKSE